MKKIYRSFFWRETGELEDYRARGTTDYHCIKYWTDMSPERFAEESRKYDGTGDWWWVEVEYEEGV